MSSFFKITLMNLIGTMVLGVGLIAWNTLEHTSFVAATSSISAILGMAIMFSTMSIRTDANIPISGTSVTFVMLGVMGVFLVGYAPIYTGDQISTLIENSVRWLMVAVLYIAAIFGSYRLLDESSHRPSFG